MLTVIWYDINWLNWREFEWVQSKCLNPSAGSVNRFLLWRKHSESAFYKEEVQAVWPQETKNQEESSLKDPEWFFFFFFFMSSDLCKDLSFSREQKSMCPIRVPCFKSLGRLVAAEMNLQGWCFLCYSRDLTLTLSLGCPEPDCGEATSTAKMCVQFPWSVLLSLPQTSFSTLLLPSSVSNALMLFLSRANNSL